MSQINLDEETPYTLRKEKRSFDMFLLSITGIGLAFIIGRFFTYKMFELFLKQEQRIEQLEKKLSQLQDRR